MLVLPGPLDVIDVDWSSLMPKQKQEPRAAGAALLRFTPGAVLLRAGISKRLAGPELLEQVREVCKSELDDPKGESRGVVCRHRNSNIWDHEGPLLDGLSSGNLSVLNSVRFVPADAEKLFEHELGALNMAALNRRVERAGLLSNLGPCCKALCARRDFAIRRQLLKNDKVRVRSGNGDYCGRCVSMLAFFSAVVQDLVGPF